MEVQQNLIPTFIAVNPNGLTIHDGPSAKMIESCCKPRLPLCVHAQSGDIACVHKHTHRFLPARVRSNRGGTSTTGGGGAAGSP